jgi:ankyrin repeat protein
MASSTSDLVRLPPMNNLASNLTSTKSSKKLQPATLITTNSSNKSKKETFALHQSVLDGRLKQLNYFLKMGMKVDSKDKFGRTCLMLACLCDHEEYGLQLAKVLMKHDANINMVDSLGRTALFIAVTEKREKLFDYFIQNHSSLADFRIKDNDGNILLNHVAIHGTREMLRSLIDIMIERHVELDQRNLCGYTALLLAIKNDKYVNAFELAKESQVSLSLRDNECHFNALEWLLSRIDLNKNFLYNRNSICSSLDDMLSVLSTSTDRQNVSNKNRKLPKVDTKLTNRKELLGSLNQYFNDNSLCEHTSMPDFATEYQKSRFVPPIYTPRISVKKETNNSTRSDLNLSIKDLVEKNNDLDENMTLRELVQRLYELIYKKMADSSNQVNAITSHSLTSIGQQFDAKVNNTAQNKENNIGNNKASSSKTNMSKQRSNSNASSIGPKTSSNDMRSDSFSKTFRAAPKSQIAQIRYYTFVLFLIEYFFY